MSSSTDSDNQAEQSPLNTIFTNILKEYPVLLDKSQLPASKSRKQNALDVLKKTIEINCGKTMNEKNILKKISNMKTQVKKKTDLNKTGNNKITLCEWEKELYDIIKGDSNPTITKLTSSVSCGFPQSSQNRFSCEEVGCSSTPGTTENKAPPKKKLKLAGKNIAQLFVLFE